MFTCHDLYIVELSDLHVNLSDVISICQIILLLCCCYVYSTNSKLSARFKNQIVNDKINFLKKTNDAKDLTRRHTKKKCKDA